MKDSTIAGREYLQFVADLKSRIQSARLSAVRAVNRDLILLYWDIGRAIVEKQTQFGWGESVVEMLSRDLQAEFPHSHGFSVQNLWRMRQFYATYALPDFLAQVAREMKAASNADVVPILSQAVRELEKASPADQQEANLSQAVRDLLAAIPWGHHVNLLIKVKDPAARLYYLRATAQLGWSRNVLLNQIKAGAYERALKEKKTHNFELAAKQLADAVREVLPSKRKT